MTPIHKKDELENPGNWRPISLLSCVSKVFERIIHDSLITFLDTHNIITPHQFGFRKSSSTTDQLLDVYDRLLKNLDNRLTTKILFLDMSKAFDKVWHRGLLAKLERIGIRGKTLDLITS